MASLLTRLREELGFVRGNLLVLIVSYTIFRFSFSLHIPFQSLYVRELGATPFLLGLMSSLGSAILASIRIPGAHIADRYGRRKIIVTFTYGAALAYLLYAIAPDWWFILLALVVSNLSHIYQPALEAIEADSMPPERRGMGYAAINVLPGVSAIVAAPIGGLLVERLGLVPGMRMVYGVVFSFTVAVAVVRTLFLEETLEEPEGFSFRELGSSFRESLGSIAEPGGRCPGTWPSSRR